MSVLWTPTFSFSIYQVDCQNIMLAYIKQLDPTTITSLLIDVPPLSCCCCPATVLSQFPLLIVLSPSKLDPFGYTSSSLSCGGHPLYTYVFCTPTRLCFDYLRVLVNISSIHHHHHCCCHQYQYIQLVNACADISNDHDFIQCWLLKKPYHCSIVDYHNSVSIPQVFLLFVRSNVLGQQIISYSYVFEVCTYFCNFFIINNECIKYSR